MLPAESRALGRILSRGFDDLSPIDLPSIDWAEFVDEAQKQGLGPALYWILAKARFLRAIPNSSRDLLRYSYARALIQNQYKLRELERMAKRFQEADIPVIALKGICFALTIYPDIGLRPMGDMDLLVPASRLDDAVRIAQALGYEDTKPEASPGLRDLLGHEVLLEKKGEQAVILELHHSLVADKTYRYAVPVDWFWEGAEPLRLSSSKKRFSNVLMLSPEAQTLYAASHAMLQHGGQKSPLLWFYDLDRLIHHYKERFDWDLLLFQSAKFEWGSALAAALLWTSDCFGTPLPVAVRARLSQNTDRHSELVALKKVLPATHTLEEWQKFVSLNWYGRLRFVLALAFPSPAYMRWRYRQKTSWLLPIWYLYRWWGIFKDLVATIVHVISKPHPIA